MTEIDALKEKIINWAKAEPRVRALFWYGSHSINRARADSDLDVAILSQEDTAPSWGRLEQQLGDVRLTLGANAHQGRITYFLGDVLRRVDISWSNKEEGLAWLADCPEVPEPRLVLAFERNGAGQCLAGRAAAKYEIDRPKRAHEEIEKFLDGFEAASLAHSRSDAYSFYFHYNLAIQRLARLVAIARNGPPRFYLVPQLTNTLLTEPERGPFIALNAPMDLKQGNQAKLRLQEQFLKFVAELEAEPMKLDVDIPALGRFMDKVRIRDAMYNVRDVGVWLGAPLQSGRLFRASVLSRWQHEPFLREWLNGNQIKTIIDLRAEREGEGPAYEPDTLQGINYRRFPVGSQGGRAPNAQRTQKLDYFSVLGRYPQMFVSALRCLRSDAPPTVIHCKAGMDRTGIFIALVGLVLDVREELILADYEASGVSVSREWMDRFCKDVREKGGIHTVLGSYGWTREDTDQLRGFFNRPKAP